MNNKFRLTGVSISFILPRILILLLTMTITACGSDSSSSGSSEPTPPSATSSQNTIGALMLEFDGAAQITANDLLAMESNPEVQKFLQGGVEKTEQIAAVMQLGGPQDFTNETPLPHSTQADVSAGERFLLKTYLNHPRDATLASFLALVNLNRSLLSSSARKHPGKAFKYTVLSQYFLSRAKDLGRTDRWIPAALMATQVQIDRVLARQQQVTSEENHPAHKFFNETFNYYEGDRYAALEKLLDDFVQSPKNVYTAFTITATNLWIGGEGDFEDPTVLQNFVLGSFFSIHTMKLAQQLEVAWLADNTATPRFRMASILGGFSALQRRWLAKVHNQPQAIAALDDEHRQWRLIQRSFHAFTVGLSFFEEPQNSLEGFNAWQDGFAYCFVVPNRTCTNQPRFSHNFGGFILGYVDALLQVGQVDAAKQFLSIRHDLTNFPPMAAYAQWDLGRAAWEYRENNADAIAARYANADPSDDQFHFFLKKRKWGANTATCQACHQAQSSIWTEEEKNTIVLPPEPVATVGIWPVVSTTWYGGSI